MDYTFLLKIINCLFLSCGFFINIFLVTKKCIWPQKGPHNTIDIILISLGMVRSIVIIFWIPLILIHDDEFLSPAKMFLKYIVIASYFGASCSLWWGAILCVFYCMKITNYSNRLFMRLKMNISRWVPWLLLMTMVVSFLSSLPYVWFMYSVRYINSTQVSNGTRNDETIALKMNTINLVLIRFLGNVTPFIISCAAISPLVISLLKHTRNMSSKDSGFTKSQTVALKKAIINMASFLFFFILFFVGFTLLPLTFQEPLYRFICRLIYSCCPCLHSVILLASDEYLKRFFGALQCCAWKRNPG